MALLWEEFYDRTPRPSNLDENEKLLNNFAKHHIEKNNKIVLITSGGTTVPLEHNTVRFVDNFSAGNRGSISAEYFLDHGYAVIFMHRLKSLEPFSRHFSGHKFLDIMNLTMINDVTSISVAPQYVNKISKILRKYKETLKDNKLLQICFTTLSEYLWLLRSACQALTILENRAILYLAAAVSDFYIPSNEMLVIANILQTRKQQVVFVSQENDYILSLTNEQIQNGEEIEKFIVQNLIEKHEIWMRSQKLD
ncbi:PREDICTED: phosphopantothenate--cysteine ligase CAB2-like isoform X2 [Ceratosolen solmsi marchali]|uniref:Phosphopantothenate--cysteine ligase CAB2-like isoform X2 n=1 Tax=Ceratosolen solmsi marchali TaxID=326594 RepID=A0AAJ6YMD7_9HYME|nr:PREDICTED: phosphopantothenate--cysteine ligase CAB2-like isoform X2 [Ceratosolen solmsi marchali]XP_011500726.1 PREDICTED: phosphopantothenate--cysteine ligase CAB2-like isoform X2 [Ceratosolen solmsi marchali]XP_011503945.1 PREDICTED: phosphopantothenate--cysteine ligase CAB2-like isoform X2 [Ceratosolen solmsi marchali]